MHTKHLSYEDTIKELKELEYDQSTDKAIRNHQFSLKDGLGSQYHKKVLFNKRQINTLLSLIKVYKESRRMFAKLNGWGSEKGKVDTQRDI